MNYNGKTTTGKEFYKILTESKSFTSELGKVTLASGKLEVELILYMKRKGIKEKLENSTLGTLIKLADKYHLIDNNLRTSLKLITKQRNYLTHNIYALLNDLIGESILEKENLLDSDVDLYKERAWQLNKNICTLADKIKNKN